MNVFYRFYFVFNRLLYRFIVPNLNNLIMNTIEIKEKVPRNLICSFLGHKFITTRNVTEHFKEYKCTVCDLELTNDLEGHKTYLTPKLKEINESLLSLYKKRHYSI